MTSAIRTARRAAAAVALLSLAGLAGACSSAPPPQPSPSVATPGPSQTKSPASTEATTSTAPTSPAHSSHPAAAGPQPCPTRSLRVSLASRGAAAGSSYQDLVFTNISSVTCTLYGYPGVSLAGGSPVSQIGLAAQEDPATPRQLVTLAPGGQGSALLRIVVAQNYPASRCGPVQASYLQVYPPNQTTPVYVAYSATACSKPRPLLTVDAVKPGSGG